MTAVKLYVLPVSAYPGTYTSPPYSVGDLLNFEPRNIVEIPDTGTTITVQNILDGISTYLNGAVAKYDAYLYTCNFVTQFEANTPKSLTDPTAYWWAINKDTVNTSTGSAPKTTQASPLDTDFVLAVYPKTSADHLLFSTVKH